MLRKFINGTACFVTLGDALAKSQKSSMRMLSQQENPQVRNLFEIISSLQKSDGTTLAVRAMREVRAAKKAA